MTIAAPSFSTEPPEVASRSLKRRIGEIGSAVLMPMIRTAARPFLGGETVEDALCAAERLHAQGIATAFSYWDGGREELGQIEELGRTAITALAAKAPASYLSLKPPALRFSKEAAAKLAREAAARRVRLHFDSHGADVADRHNAMLEAMLEVLGPEYLGTTLPARLMRTGKDAEWAMAHGLNVRVVKGEWPDPANLGCDLNAAYLDIIDRLAGRARHVAVATHDPVLSRTAIAKLRAAGTSCEIEVLLGLAPHSLIDWAKANDVGVRVYVPYGCGFVMNALGVLRRNPRLTLAIARAQIAYLATAFSRR
jgi:proline dehydrogenase